MSRILTRELRLRCAPQRAFEAFTAEIDAWWPPGHRRFPASTIRFEARVGGRLLERSAAGEEAVLGEVRRWEPPRRLAYSWHPGALTAPTEVEVRFAAEGEGTLVTVVHAEGGAELGDAWPDRLAIFRRSWREVLWAFADHLEGA